MTDRSLLDRIPGWTEECPHCHGAVRVLPRFPGVIRVWLAGCFPRRRVRVPSERSEQIEARDLAIVTTFDLYRRTGTSFRTAVALLAREWRLDESRVRQVLRERRRK